MNAQSMDREILETVALEGMAVVTDLPDTPPVKKLFPDLEDHTDMPLWTSTSKSTSTSYRVRLGH